MKWEIFAGISLFESVFTYYLLLEDFVLVGVFVCAICLLFYRREPLIRCDVESWIFSTGKSEIISVIFSSVGFAWGKKKIERIGWAVWFFVDEKYNTFRVEFISLYNMYCIVFSYIMFTLLLIISEMLFLLNKNFIRWWFIKFDILKES